MPHVNFDWVRTQLTRAKVRQVTGDAVLTLLHTWETISFTNDSQRQDSLDMFTTLAQGHLITPESSEWVPVQSRGVMLRVGDEVRVKSDAFTGDLGTIHNGRIGRVVAKRYGDIIVKHTDGLTPSRDDARYSPSVLEIRPR